MKSQKPNRLTKVSPPPVGSGPVGANTGSQGPSFGLRSCLALPEWSVAGCRVGPDLGSDHLPVIAEFILPRGDRSAAKGGATRP